MFHIKHILSPNAKYSVLELKKGGIIWSPFWSKAEEFKKQFSVHAQIIQIFDKVFMMKTIACLKESDSLTLLHQDMAKTMKSLSKFGQSQSPCAFLYHIFIFHFLKCLFINNNNKKNTPTNNHSSTITH